MNLRNTYLTDFINLLFPRLCHACSTTLLGTEQLICTTCLYDLPFTNFHLQQENIVTRQFWGKIDVQWAYAMLYFEKDGKVQQLLHQLKYKGIASIGNKLGNMAGNQLLQSPYLQPVDFIMPVPLHKSRQRERGYNQSTCFAQGLAKVLQCPVMEHNLVRNVKTNTQTHKSRFERFENMKDVFTVLRPEPLYNKHILLVDDVLTTGSTLEACAEPLIKINGIKLSIATIAYAS